MSQSVAKFITIVAMHFPKPRFESEGQEAMWVTSMVRMLGSYPDPVLSRAADSIIRQRDRKKDGAYFPVPSECISECEKAKRAIDLESRPLLEVAQKGPDQFSPERAALTVDLMRGEMGKQAAREGWHGALYNFVFSRCRLPQGMEIENCKRAAAGFKQDLAACERGEMGKHSRQWAQLGRSIERKREELRAQIKGDAA